MKKEPLITLLLILALSIPACAQQPKKADDIHDVWVKMTDDAVTLYTQRRHKEAIALAEKALEYAKKNFGEESPDVAESMDNLATYLTAEGEYKKAEELYRKALAIVEKNFGKESEYTAIFLNYLSDFYRKIGNEEEADKLTERAKEIRHKIR
jgi:tetratricopeptide (TPR) repeat protein